ncbi:MAG: hypothetical protein QXR69_00630 [Conexivisphaerales archaeon]
MRRTNISVEHSIFEEFSNQARKQNKTLFAFTNETLDAVARIYAEGGDIKELYKLWESFYLIKRYIDVLTLPADFVDELIDKVYVLDKEGTLKMFRDLANGLVGILKMIAPDIDSLAAVATDFMILMPVKTLKVTKLDQRSVSVDIIKAGRRLSSTECTAEFVVTVLSSYGYHVMSKEVNVGLIRIRATKTEEQHVEEPFMQAK